MTAIGGVHLFVVRQSWSAYKISHSMSSKVTDVDRTPVAQDILCFNSKENAKTWHVVVNHDIHGYVDRVQCKVTGVVRKYKRQNKTLLTAKKRVSSGAAPKASSSAMLEEEWLKGIKVWGDKVVPSYSPEKSFNKGDVLLHPVFGKGLVQGRRENKVDILFKSEIKTLQSKG